MLATRPDHGMGMTTRLAGMVAAASFTAAGLCGAVTTAEVLMEAVAAMEVEEAVAIERTS